MMGADAAERRVAVTLTHAYRTAAAVLLAVAVVRSWRTGEHPVAAGALALAIAATTWSTAVPAAVAALALWAVAAWLSAGFAWVAFCLYFLVLHAFSRPVAAVVVALVAAWSVWCTGSFLGPVIGALAAVLGSLVFHVQRADAQRHRELVAELREAQSAMAVAERERGVLAERERLAREIHDTVGQGLASIVVLARTGGRQALHLIEETARDNLAQARRFVREPGAPGEVGLVEGLRALVDDTRARATASGRPLDLSLTVDGPDPAPEPAVVTALLRAAQASLANVLQHARARRCVVGVSTFGDRVVVDIVDDGCGFDPSSVGPDSFGLRGLAARVAELGGSLSVEAEPGSGTTIGVTAPLTRRETR